MSELVMIANADDGSISVLTLYRDGTPRLELLRTTGGLDGCGTFAVDPARDLVHAAYKGDRPGIATLRLDRETGALDELSRHEVEEAMAYLSLAQDGTLLLGASYGGGLGEVWPVQDADLDVPRLGEAVPQQEPVRFARLHCVVPDRGGADPATVVYFVSLGDDLVAQYTLAPDGTLTPLDPPTVAAPAGSGPRHLIVDGADAYLMTEFSGEAVHLRRAADGGLTPAGALSVVNPEHGLTHSRLDADPEEEHLIWGADVHRAGSWLITSERMSSELATVRLDAGGALADEVAHFTPTQKQPRGFNVTDDGAYVIAVGERSPDAELLQVEPDGALTSLGTVRTGQGPNWVRIVS